MNEIDDFASPSGDDAGSIWLNDLFERARSPGTAEELSSESEVVDAMMRAMAQPPLVSDINARRRLGISKTATRTAIVAAALLVGTSTAAATGNLPDGAQSAVARASSHFGVDIPDPYDESGTSQPDSSGPTTEPPSTDTPITSTVVDDPSAAAPTSEVQPASGTPTPTDSNPKQAVPESTDSPDAQPSVPPETATPGPDVTGPEKQGLCRAWAAHGADSPANQHSTAMKRLQAAAAAAGQTVAEFCAEALGSESTEVATTTAEATPTTVVDDQGNKKNKKGTDDGEKDKSEKDKKEKDKKAKGPKEDG